MDASPFDFEVFPVLTTPRLVLREITHDDAEAIFEIRADEDVTRYNGGVTYTRIEQAVTLINGITESYRDKRSLRWGITLKGADKVIGMCGYNYWVRQDFRASIGYDLARPYWGMGIMPEAIHAVIQFGFIHMGLNRIEADATSDNHNSIRVLEKVGFTREGVQREQYYERGEFFDLILFSLLRRSYFEANSSLGQ